MTNQTVVAPVVAPIVAGPSQKQRELLPSVLAHMVKYATHTKKPRFLEIASTWDDEKVLSLFGRARTFHGCFMAYYWAVKAAADAAPVVAPVVADVVVADETPAEAWEAQAAPSVEVVVETAPEAVEDLSDEDEGSDEGWVETNLEDLTDAS